MDAMGRERLARKALHLTLPSINFARRFQQSRAGKAPATHGRPGRIM